jgi:hypothetical protein
MDRFQWNGGLGFAVLAPSHSRIVRSTENVFIETNPEELSGISAHFSIPQMMTRLSCSYYADTM